MSKVGEPSEFDRVRDVIRRRQTFKVFADPESPCELSPADCAEWDETVRQALLAAGHAPFHYERDPGGIAEPWRAHVLWQRECRITAQAMEDWLGEAGSAGKLPAMLAACGAAIITTWVPQFRHLEEPKPGQVLTDDEHLAAASAMVQNLLLLLTAAGMGSYWSSGGRFRSQEVYSALGLSTDESLLGVIFVEYPGTLREPLERIPGKHREKRTDRWIREIKLDV
ncbi:MAG: nitroreductase family protein [Planctomycetota bacterium]